MRVLGELVYIYIAEVEISKLYNKKKSSVINVWT